MRLTEFSPDTFTGSITKDLLISKLWLCQELKKLNFTEFDVIYILGSWYGIMAYTLNRCGISADKIINVDINKQRLEFSDKLLDKFNNVISMNKDANKLNYQQLNSNGLVINTSTNDIDGTQWFENIPSGTLIVIQSRNDVEDTTNLKLFDKKYPLSKTMYVGEKSLKDPEVKYRRFMKIGVK